MVSKKKWAKRGSRVFSAILASALVLNSGAFEMVQAAELSEPIANISSVEEGVVEDVTDTEESVEESSASEESEDVENTESEEDTTEQTTEGESTEEETTEEETTEEQTVIENVTASKKDVKITFDHSQDTENKKTYSPQELEVGQNWGATVTVEDGITTYQFEKQYSQISYKLPEDVEASRIEKVICNLTDGESQYFSMKFLNDKGLDGEIGVAYGTSAIEISKLDSSKGSAEDINAIGLMNLYEGEYDFSIESITFMLGEEKTSNKDDEKEKTFKISDLELAANWNVEMEEVEEGTAFNFTKQYGAASFMVPESVEPRKIEKIIFDVSDSSRLAVKFFSDNGMQNEMAVAYGSNQLSVEAIDTSKGSAEDIMTIGVMGLEEGFQTTIESVTFVLGDGKEVVVDKSIGDLTKDCFKSAANNNPIVTQRYSADPGVMVYNDTVYVYSTNDVYEYDAKGAIKENGYGLVKTINCFSSTDLVNWTDHGAIEVAGKGNDKGAAKWANNSWAPCAAHKTINGEEKFFLYFADNGSGIGVLTSDSPTGPWVDPLGKQLISRQTPTCSSVEWLFDPAVLVDDDGSAYLYFGGGVPSGKAADPGTARVVKLGEDMISLDGDPVQINPPYLFEDSGINKVDGKYIYSYCSNWNCADGFVNGTIEYMVSDNPMGPFTYAGELFRNPSTFFHDGNGNNHHSMFEFKGQLYLAYHARALELGAIGSNKGYRSTQIDKVTYKNGKLESVTGTMQGVSQVGYLNPYKTVNATTIARQKGIEVIGDLNPALTVTAGDWTSLKGVDFANGLSEMTMNIKANEDMTVQVRTGSETGTVIGEFQVAASDSFVDVTANMKNITGVKNLFFTFSGSAEVRSWQAEAGNIFTFDQLEKVVSYGLTTDISAEGAITISYDEKWAEIRFALPEKVDAKKVNKIILNLSDGNGNSLAVKALHNTGEAQEELNAAYNNSSLDISGLDEKEKFNCFGIMSMSDDPCTVIIDSVTFEMEAEDDVDNPGIETDIPDLRDAVTAEMGSDFIVGTAICLNEISDKKLMALVTKHFNAVTFGNELKPDCLLNKNNIQTVTLNGEEIQVPSLNFSSPEKMLEKIYKWNRENPDDFIKVRGHVLTWHSQTPEWFFHEDYDVNKPFVSAAEMTKRHEWYIKSVLEHFVGEDSKYKDMFYGWDVVNEAVSDSRGTYRNDSENSSWWKVYQSNEFIINAFRFANKYAPASLELYYNDYSECDAKKVVGIEQLLKDVKNAEGTRIDGMGMQGHYHTTDYPSIDDFKNAARTYAKVVGKLQLTELDYQCSADYDGTAATADEENMKLANRYKAFYDAVKELESEGIDFTNITVWGVVDKNSWLQNASFVGGGASGNKKQMPLLFDDDYQAKPAYWAFVDDTKLKSPAKKFDIVQASASDNIYASGSAIAFAGENIKATAIPVWYDNTIYVQVQVEDAVADPFDQVKVYLCQDGTIQRKVVSRAQAVPTEDGYVATVKFTCKEKSLVTAAKVQMDFVVEDGAEKIAFNDQSFSQDSSADSYAKGTIKPCFCIARGTIDVDGELDEVWKTVDPTELTINLGANVTANAKLLWDEKNLYAYVDVKDAVLNADSAQAHEKDSFELFIDENNHKSASYEEDDKQYRINYLNEQSFNGQKCVADNIKSAAKITEDGYVIEVAVAWTDITPEIGSNIGLELQINDANASGKRDGTLSWFDNSGNGWQNPSVFGTAVLVEEIGKVEIKADIQWNVPDLRDSVTAKLGKDFLVGATIGGTTSSDANIMALVTKHFNAVSIENELKPDALFGYVSDKPQTETVEFNGKELLVPKMDYSRAEKILDKIYDWNQAHPDQYIKVRGHVLTWHSQTPEWFFKEGYVKANDFVDKDTMTIRHEWFIKTVLEHFCGEDSKYKGMFYGWDVVNEAVSDSTGTYRNENENSMWWKVYQSNEFIINAFRFANKYAPADLELYYNDYSECSENKSKGIAQLLTDVKNAEGTRIDAMGMQSHHSTNAGSPTMDQFKKAVRKYADIVGKVQLTELDFTTSNGYDGSLAMYDAENTKLAYRYKEFYQAIAELKAEGVNVSGMTIWGTIDKYSWLQSDSRPEQIPMLFDNDYMVKPAYWAFVDASVLEPQVKEFDVLQSTDGSFENGVAISFAGEKSSATVIPVWDEKGLHFDVDVKDATVDENDKFVIYISINNALTKVEVPREIANQTATGYEAVVDAGLSSLAVNSKIGIDFVIVNGDEKVAFNDYRFSQEISNKYFANAIIKPFMGIRQGSAVVDGELDESFAKVDAVPLKIALGAKAEASVRLLWDAEKLYAYIDVKDAVLNADSSQVHEKDSVEIFIDEMNHKATSYGEDDKQYRVNYLNEQSFNGKKCNADHITSAVKLTEDGYVIEVAIAWTDLTPAVGAQVGLELQINDADDSGKRIGTLSWFDTTGNGWQNPSVFGTVTLLGAESTDEDKPGTGEEQPGTGEDKPATNPGTGSSSASNGQSSATVTVDVKTSTNISVIDEQDVPLAMIPGVALPMFDLRLDYKAQLRNELLMKYRGQNMYLFANLGSGIGFTIHSEQNFNSDINMIMNRKEIPDYSGEFDAVSITPIQKAKLSFNLGLHVNLGTQYVGKTAYIFKKSLSTGKYEQESIVKVNEIGNVMLHTNELTDVIVFIAK